MEKLETILVVDQADSLLELVVPILEKAHFVVLQAKSGTGAIDLAASYAGKIDLVLSGIKLPEMSGPALSDTLKLSRPGTRVMFMSAFPGGSLLVLNYGWALIDRLLVPSKLLEMVNVVLHTLKQSQGNHQYDTRKDEETIAKN